MPTTPKAILYYFVPPMAPEHTKIQFPLWHYLNQPLFSRDTKFIWNPRQFAFIWRIQMLERCWAKHSDAKGQQQS